MNILEVYSSPDVKHGTELSMHLGASGLRALEHRTFLLHAMSERPAMAQEYTADLGVPAVFDRASKISPRALPHDERAVEAFIADNKIDLIHVHGYPRTETLRRWTRRHRVFASIHVPLCPNGSRYLWRERCVCDRKPGLTCLTAGYIRHGCGRLGNGKPMGLPGFVRGMVEDHLLRDALNGCTRLIANSQWMRERLIADGFPPSHVVVEHEPVVDGTYEEVDTSAATPPVIAYIGRLVDFKGPDHLLRASQMLDVPHQLWFIGAGAMRAELENLADELGLRDRVQFLGGLKPEQIAAYRAQSTVVVVPSLWPEPFAMVGPEAMLMQKPVVAYRVGGIPEWLKDGSTGHLVEPGNITAFAAAINVLLNAPEQARKMGHEGQQVAHQWKPKQHAERLLRIYSDVLTSPCDGGSVIRPAIDLVPS